MKEITKLEVPEKQGISCQLISSHFFKKFPLLPGKETEPKLRCKVSCRFSRVPAVWYVKMRL